MHSDEPSASISTKTLIIRLVMLLSISISAALAGGRIGLDQQQMIASGVFLAIILGTLFFWSFRLAIAFLGIAVLIFTRSLDIPTFVESAALEVILFLVGMMIVVGALRDLGFFTWVVQMIVSMPNITGKKFIIVLCITSALLACAVDEVTSIIFVSTLVFQVCERLKLKPTPYLIICVLCTNVGSAGTMLGNPVGIYIGTQAGLTFKDFIIWAFPIMFVALMVTIFVTIVWFRKELKEFDTRLKERLARDLSLVPQVEVPYKRGLALLIITIAFIASHHFLEETLHLAPNSILLVAPLACSGAVMILRRDRARHYVEREVDWWTLLFFMLLFAIAGTLEHSGVTAFMAEKFVGSFGNDVNTLIPVIMASTAIGSAFVDNVIFVAAFCPVVESLGETLREMFGENAKVMPLWWALLYGACFGGNITMIGSTANIVALGMLEKQCRINVTFFQWLKVGAFSAVIACSIAWALLLVLAPFMPW